MTGQISNDPVVSLSNGLLIPAVDMTRAIGDRNVVILGVDVTPGSVTTAINTAVAIEAAAARAAEAALATTALTYALILG
jgi:hypothetical protein